MATSRQKPSSQSLFCVLLELFLSSNFLITFVCIQTSELGVTEHVEGDPCKFALWVGRTPASDNKIVLKVRSVRLGSWAV